MIFFSNKTNIEIIKKLIVELNIKDFKILNKKGKFANKTLMFTGGFKKISRSEAKSLVEQNGGKVLSAISKIRYIGYWRFKTNSKKNSK